MVTLIQQSLLLVVTVLALQRLQLLKTFKKQMVSNLLQLQSFLAVLLLLLTCQQVVLVIHLCQL